MLTPQQRPQRRHDLRPEFAQPKAKLAEKPLALPDLQTHPQFPPEIRGQRQTIPHLGGQTKLGWTGPQRRLHAGKLLVIQATGTSRTFKPAKLWELKRCTRFLTMRAESPNNCAACGHVKLWATNNTP